MYKMNIALTDTDLRNQLLGSLIGLVRAADNNEELILAATNHLILETMSATADCSSVLDAQLLNLQTRIIAEKQRIVPDCFHCASPCGRTDDYDMKLIWEADDKKAAAVKVQILEKLQRFAASVVNHTFDAKLTEDQIKCLYKALYLLGVDLEEEYLIPILKEVKNLFNQPD